MFKKLLSTIRWLSCVLRRFQNKERLFLFPDTAVSGGLLYPRRSVITARYKLNI